jgi:hypothetical protein
MVAAGPDLETPVQLHVGLLAGSRGIEQAQLSGNRPHRRIREIRRQVGKRVRIQHLPHVGEEQNVPRRLRQTGIQRRGFAAARNAQ